MSTRGAAPAKNVLVMAPAMSDGKTEQCYDLLTQQDPETIDLLRVVYHRSPDLLLAEWTDVVGESPDNTVVVGVDDRVQTGTIGPDDEVAGDGAVKVLAANPNDLTGLGMELNNALKAVASTDNDVYVCFDSITALLQFTDVESAYKFLHMFTGQLHKVDAHAHFHMDPEAHDTQTISRLKTTFDDLVEVEE